jgi:anti-sigma-K factor RskA
MTDHAQYVELLPLYAVGALDPGEERDLEAHLRSCAECQSELAAFRGDAALLALSAVGPAPPQRARQRLVAAIASEPRKQPVWPEMILGTLRPRWLAFVPMAAAVLLAIFSLMLWRVESKLQSRLDRTQAELQDTQEQLQKDEELVALLNSPESMRVTLVAAKSPPQPQVKTVYSPKMGRLLLVAGNLQSLPQNKVYELWLLPTNGGAPMPAGTFRTDAQGNATMDHMMPEAGIAAKGFAITMEPEGGSATPTLPILMINAG